MSSNPDTVTLICAEAKLCCCHARCSSFVGNLISLGLKFLSRNTISTLGWARQVVVQISSIRENATQGKLRLQLSLDELTDTTTFWILSPK